MWTTSQTQALRASGEALIPRAHVDAFIKRRFRGKMGVQSAGGGGEQESRSSQSGMPDVADPTRGDVAPPRIPTTAPRSSRLGCPEILFSRSRYSGSQCSSRYTPVAPREPHRALSKRCTEGCRSVWPQAVSRGAAGAHNERQPSQFTVSTREVLPWTRCGRRSRRA